MIENMDNKVDQLLESRLIALSQKKGAILTEEATQSEIDTIQKYLFGDGGYGGLIDLLALYAKELNDLRASTFSAPSLHSGPSKSSWVNQFKLAVRVQGDGAGGFFPPDSNGIGQEEINTSTAWLTNNGYSEGSAGLYTLLSNLESARDALWQKRIEVYPPGDPSEGLVIDPYYYSNPEKSNLLNAIQAVSSFLNTYGSDLESLKGSIDLIKGGSSPIFSYLNIMDDVTAVPQAPIDEVDALETFYSNAYPYFNTVVSNSASEATINAYLDPSSSDATRSFVLKEAVVESYITTRTATLKSRMGFTDLTTGIKKWIYFFIRLLIEKPSSPYGTLVGIGTSIDQAKKKLLSLWDMLGMLFGDPDQYVLAPQMIATYVMPDENAPLGNKVEVVFQTIPCVPQTKIWRKQITPEEVLSNDQWVESGSIEVIETVESENPVLLYSDTSIPEREGQLFAYRVSLHDAGTYRIDLEDSGSNQSDLLGKEISFTKNSDYEIEILNHDFAVGGLFYISGSGTYRILGTTQNTITVDRIISGSGNLQRLFGVVHLFEEE